MLSPSPSQDSAAVHKLCIEIAQLYFTIQGQLIIIWWGVMAATPEYQPLFFPADASTSLLVALAIPDLLVAGLGSMLVASLLSRKPALARKLTWLVTSFLLMMTLLCAYWTITTGAAALGTGMMVSCSLLSIHVSILASRSPLAIFAPFVGGRLRAAIETTVQVSVFWLLFLGAFPLLFAMAQEQLGWPLFTLPGQWWWAAVLFLLFASLGLSSSWTMVRRGRGTPLPMRQASELVVAGPYRWLRNPMAVAGLGQGVAMAIGHGTVLFMLICVCGGFVWNYTIRPVEEANMRERFGEQFEDYRKRVRCWWP